MKPLFRSGFTIIEVMLVLSITGLLMAGAIIGVGASVNNQKYRDTLSSLQDLLQKQFNNVNNTSHYGSTWKCSISGGNPTLVDVGSSQSSGKSDCVMLGKYITTSNGQDISIRNVVGVASTSFASDDITALTNSRIVVSSAGSESYTLSWGSTLKNTSGSIISFSVLMLRSPTSGVIRTFINSGSVTADNNIRNLINTTYLQNSMKACIKSDGSINSDKSAIFIAAGAANASSVEIQGDSISGC